MGGLFLFRREEMETFELYLDALEGYIDWLIEVKCEAARTRHAQSVQGFAGYYREYMASYLQQMEEAAGR